jgi:hypothetical protein
MSSKISDFTQVQTFETTDLVNIVRNATNYTVPFSAYAVALGVTGTIVPIGSNLAVPILEQPSTAINNIRGIEATNGIIAALSAQNGISLKQNFTWDKTGEPLIVDETVTPPVVKSLVAKSNMAIVTVGNTIEFSSSFDSLNNRVVVKVAADLAGVLDSTKEYFIDGIIDMGSQSVTVPAGGLSLAGYSFDISQLTSTAAGYTMFISGGGGSGNVIGKDYAISVSGATSKVYELVSATGGDAVEFSRVNYNDCTSLGSISGYRQGLEVGTGRFGGKPQLEFIGTWSGGYFIDTSIVRSLDDGAYTLFKAGAGFIMSSRFRSNQNIDLPASASFIDFSASNFVNPSTLQLDGCLISRAGVFDSSDTNIIPNVGAENLVSKWVSNDGIINTFVGGDSIVTAEIVTTISTPGAYVDLSGTFTASDLQHFDAPSNGHLRHLGTSPTEYKVSGQIVVVGGSGDTVAIKIVVFRSATTTFEDSKITTRVINNLQGARNVAYTVIFGNVVLNQSDYVKLQVANITDTSDVTAELDSFFSIEAR